MTMRRLVLAIVVLAMACDDEGSRERDAGPFADAGLDAGEVDAGSLLDASTDGGEPSCEVGAEATGSVGPAGGSLSLCGARVAMTAGVLDAERELTLRIVALPEPAPYPLEAGGLAFEVKLEGGVPPAAMAPLEVIVPHLATSRYTYFFRHDASEGYQQIEACTVEEMAIGQAVYADGIYVALVDTEDFPTPSDQLGAGMLTATFDATMSTFDLASSAFNTYAIYDQGEDGSRNFALSASQAEGEDTRYLRASFAVDAAGTPLLLEVTYGLLSEGLWGYSVADAAAPAPTFTLDTNDGEHVAGSFMAELRMGDASQAVSVSFDATAGKFRYPPELSCGMPEG
jgi:hypothetical protein